MRTHEKLLLENKAWAAETKQMDPGFFTRLAEGQQPNFLWIGCSDSRVSPTEMTQTPPGEIFIHRNIANMVVPTDLNLLSVLQYAVEVLEVKHVVVCGHYGCGGVKAALTRHSYGTIDHWLRQIKDVYRLHKSDIDAIEDEEAQVRRLVEHNVREQLMNLARTPLIQSMWAKHQRPNLHGWVYEMSDGIIHPLLELEPNTALDDAIYEFDNLAGEAYAAGTE